MGCKKKALFAGLTTVDIISLVDSYPVADAKTEAVNRLLCAGGPATNAAVAFQVLGGEATLVSRLGRHPLASIALQDIEKQGLEFIDFAVKSTDEPCVSAVTVSRDSGERSVVYRVGEVVEPCDTQVRSELLDNVSIVLTDGHLLQQSISLAKGALQSRIPVILDGGSWKEGLEDLLTLVDVAICSSQFFPPGCKSYQDVVGFLQGIGIKKIAVTQGQLPILIVDSGIKSSIDVKKVNAVDTLGAGDILHGAFCWFYLDYDFKESLERASEVASLSCTCFGTRSWIDMWLQK